MPMLALIPLGGKMLLQILNHNFLDLQDYLLNGEFIVSVAKAQEIKQGITYYIIDFKMLNEANPYRWAFVDESERNRQFEIVFSLSREAKNRLKT